MILVDTSVWVDHLRRGDLQLVDLQLVDLLERSAVVMHPFVVGRLACASLHGRLSILELLRDLPAAVVAEGDEILRFIERMSCTARALGRSMFICWARWR